MQLDFTLVFAYWHVLLKGLGLTLAFTLGCALLGSLAGFGLALLRNVRSRLLKVPAILFVEFFRGTPLRSSCSGCSSAFRWCSAWIFRPTSRWPSPDAVHDGDHQRDLPRRAEIHRRRTARRLCRAGPDHAGQGVLRGFPQALLRAVPPLLSNLVSLFKESALISSVGVADLMFVGQNISNSTARPVEFLSAVAVIYFLVAFPLTRLVGVVEARMLRRFAY